MADQLRRLLEADQNAKKYFESLPQYAREAVKKHADEIESAASMKLFAETFMSDDSFRGA
jgi:hypothetical protein